MNLPFVLTLLLWPVASGLAQDEILPTRSHPQRTTESESKKPAPELIQLDSSLTKAQEDNQLGRIDGKQYQEFVTKFRADLEAASASVKPTPSNTALHARILTRLGDSDRALGALGTALERAPASSTLRVALGQIRYDQKDYPAALAEANAALELDPQNKEALVLKHFSEGRIGTGSTAVSAPGIPNGGRTEIEQLRAPLSKESPKVQAMVPRIRAARDGGDMRTAMGLAQELMRIEPASEYTQEIYRIVEKDYARWQRVQPAIWYMNRAKGALLAGRGDAALKWTDKAVQANPAPEVMKFAEEVRKIVDGIRAEATPRDPPIPSRRDGGMPLWPMFPISGLGAAAFVVVKSRKTVESHDGFDEENRPLYGRLQQFVSGAILAGIAGAGLYLGAGYVVGMGGPLATRFMAASGQQAAATAQTESALTSPHSLGATSAVAPSVESVSAESAEVVRQVVIKKGEILNRVWDSRWGAKGAVSGPAGSSYCWGQCLPLNASAAIQRRGLSGIAGLTNNAQVGATYRVTEDIVVRVQKSIGGVDPEVIVSKADIGKLQQISESVSKIPPGTR